MHDKGMTNAHCISQDMESIIESRGFRFKETVMFGDPLDETGEQWKILGLRWDIERGEICIDVMLNYGKKKKGAYVEDNASPTSARG